ncbi:MAG: bis(5'-nucleosyl)-tetraphosphatase (symmetrical) YqeK [Clostridiales bacterium]
MNNFSCDMIDAIKEYLKNHLKETRYQHCLATAYCAEQLAIRWGVSPADAYLAGLCHDVAKGLSREESLAFLSDHKITLDESAMANPALWHAPIGAVLAQELFGVENPEILSAIRHHTIGAAAMTTLEKIIFLADLVEPGRDFAGVFDLRQLVQQDLDEAMAKALSLNLQFITQKGGVSHPLAQEALAYYQGIIK